MQTSIKPKRNRKWKIPHTVLERRTLSFSSHKNCKLKVKLWWVGAHERKKRAFCIVFFFVWKELFYDCCFISMYSVLIALSEYTYFYISKKITSYTFAVCFKIVGSFQCILNFNVWTKRSRSFEWILRQKSHTLLLIWLLGSCKWKMFSIQFNWKALVFHVFGNSYYFQTYNNDNVN